MEKPHILICGERGAGKTTLIERLMEQSPLPIAGFLTRSTPRDGQGFHSIYIHPVAAAERVCTEKNHIGNCNGQERSVNERVFNTLGVEYLRHDPGALVVMDELGFMEAEAAEFTAAVMTALYGQDHVLAAVRAKFDLPFLSAVRAHPRAKLYFITKENREELFYELLPLVRGWGRA